MNKAWITGYLTREQMEHEHPRELEEIEKKIEEKYKREDKSNRKGKLKGFDYY